MSLEEFGAWLGRELRELQKDAEAARAADDVPGRTRATKLASQLANIMARVQVRAADEGDVVRVRAADIEAAAERALAGLSKLADRIVAERSTWPTCPTCGSHHGGEFSDTDKSQIRALMERVAR